MNNIKHIWSIICTGVSIDQNSNNISLFNVIDRFTIPKNNLIQIPTKNGEKKPAVPIKFTLVTLWRKNKLEGDFSADAIIELLDPSELVVQKAEYKINMPDKIRRLRSSMEWTGLRVTTSGVYTFRTSIKSANEKKYKKIGETYLEINLT